MTETTEQLQKRIRHLEAIVRLAEMLIQPGDAGPELEGHSKFRNILMRSLCNYKYWRPERDRCFDLH